MHNEQRSNWWGPDSKDSKIHEKEKKEELWHDQSKRYDPEFQKLDHLYVCLATFPEPMYIFFRSSYSYSTAILRGILLGILVGSVALATILTLYLEES
ncbi:unnamed protein product, partial [Rotaria socialis]